MAENITFEFGVLHFHLPDARRYGDSVSRKRAVPPCLAPIFRLSPPFTRILTLSPIPAGLHSKEPIARRTDPKTASGFAPGDGNRQRGSFLPRLTAEIVPGAGIADSAGLKFEPSRPSGVLRSPIDAELDVDGSSTPALRPLRRSLPINPFQPEVPLPLHSKTTILTLTI